MKATAACNKLAWLACLGFSKAFLLPPSRGGGGTTGAFTRALAVSSSRPRSRPSLVAGSVPSMLVEPKGRDSFKAIEEEVEGDPIKKSVGRMKPGVAKAVLTAVIPVASAVGYVAMPSSKVAVSAIGAVATGIGGGFARKKLVQARREAAPAQVARLLESKGVGNVTPEELMRELASFGLVGEEAEDVLIQIFSKYVVAMCKNSTTKTSEIKELSELRETLGLDGLLMGEALYQAASPIYSQFVAKTPSEELEDEWSPNRRALDKFIFLCDRMFEVCDTEEAYSFEMSRVGKIFDLGIPDVKARCAAIANPFYRKALASAASKWDKVKAEQLQRARKTLGIDAEVAHEMHKEVYRSEGLALVKKEREGGAMKLDPEDRQRINKLATAFELSGDEALEEYEAVVIPIYEELLVGCLSNIMGDASPSDLARTYGQLMMFSTDTQLRQETADQALKDIMTATLQDMFQDAAQFVRVANQREAANSARGIVEFVQATLDMISINLQDDPDKHAAAFEKAVGGSIVTIESAKDAPGLYEMFLKSRFAQSEMSSKDQDSIALLAKLLDVDDVSQVKIYREAAGPRVLRQLTESVRSALDSGEFSEEAKEANEALAENFKIPYVVIQEQAKSLYKSTLDAWAGGGRILSAEQKESLDKMAAFLSMDASAVEEIHSDICSETFRKAVAESMGATGIVIDEYRAKLDELAERLGLTVRSAKAMFHAAVRQRMGPMVQQIMYEFERSVLSKGEMARKTGKDSGADVLGATGGQLGIEGGAAVTTDVLALIDFYVDNGIIEKAEGPEGGEVYPVTVKQLGTDERMLEALYQNFVVNGFGVEGEQLKRYEAGQSKLAGILGLDPAVKMKIHEEIGGTVIRRFVNQELGKAGKLSAQGVAFLANIQAKLNMPQEMFNRMMTNCKKDFVRFRAEELFRMPVMTAKDCKKLRDLAEGCDMTLENDGDLDISNRKKIFEIEAEDMIEKGELEGDAGREFVEELQEVLSLSMEEAQETLVALLDSRAKGILENVKADAIGGRDGRILEAAERLLKYCRLAGGMEVENNLDQRQRNVILNAYEAKHAGSSIVEEGSEEEENAAEEAARRAKVDDDLELLKLAIGMKTKSPT